MVVENAHGWSSGWRLGFVVALLPMLAACGLGRGYAPDAHTVHTGQSSQPFEAAGDSIRIMSWNIQYGEDLELALAEIRAAPELARADILLLQEMNTGGVKMLADSLGLHHVYSPAAVHPHHQELFGNAVLSRWPIVGHEVAVLPHATPVSGHRRLALAARLDLGRGRLLTAISVHTATVISEHDERMDQAAVAMDSLASDDGPVIVAGDFNTVTDYDVSQLRRLGRKHGYRHLRLPPGPTITNRYKRFPGSIPVLDHIFYRDLTAGSRGVMRAARASDHFPVWAVFATPPRPANGPANGD